VSRRGRVRAVAIAAALAAAAALPVAGCGSSGTSAAKPKVLPRDFAGIVTEDAFAQPGAYRRAQMAAQAHAGVGVVRQTFHWKDIETAPGRYVFGAYDGFVLDAARAGMTVLPILFEPPAFRAQPLPKGVDRATTPPKDPRSMARFAVALERRYGRGGSLWREHPGVTVRPITAWQIWNEPNLPVYWSGKPDAAAYTRLLRVVGTALKRADPRAQVVTAGLPQSKIGTPFETYLKQMYAAGAAGTFDVLAINAYSRRVTGMEAAILGARRITASAEQGDVPIWVTEFGWATRPGPGSAMTVGRKTQGRLLRLAIAMFARERKRLGIKGFVYYAWRDARPYPGGQEFWGLHTGLLNRRGHAKPSLQALRQALNQAPKVLDQSS
jgi:hypothetical protein